MAKRPSFDLTELTSDTAVPMREAIQRMAAPAALPTSALAVAPKVEEAAGTTNLEGLNFKVSPEFRKRFRRAAADANLKLNELIVAALDAWEEKKL